MGYLKSIMVKEIRKVEKDTPIDVDEFEKLKKNYSILVNLVDINDSLSDRYLHVKLPNDKLVILDEFTYNRYQKGTNIQIVLYVLYPNIKRGDESKKEIIYSNGPIFRINEIFGQIIEIVQDRIYLNSEYPFLIIGSDQQNLKSLDYIIVNCSEVRCKVLSAPTINDYFKFKEGYS
jgi:hypothetical protein